MPDPGGKEVQYWDSVLFTSFLTETIVERAESFRQLLRQVEMRFSHSRAVVSTFVIAEVRPLATHNSHHQRIVDDLFNANRPYLQFYTVTRRIAFLARDLTMQFDGLTNPAAIHLATAVIARADLFLTYDGARDNRRRRSGALLRLSEQIGDPPLKITTPEAELIPLFGTLPEPLEPPIASEPPPAQRPPGSPTERS